MTSRQSEMLILVSLMTKFRFGGGVQTTVHKSNNCHTNIHNDNCIFLNITYKSCTV